MRPYIYNLVVSFTLCYKTLCILLLNLQDFLVGKFKWKTCRQYLTKEDPADSCINKRSIMPHLNLCMFINYSCLISNTHLNRRGKHPPFTFSPCTLFCKVVTTKHNILGWDKDRRSMSRRQDIINRKHQHPGLDLRLNGKRHVNSHLITIQVCVKGHTYQRMKPYSLAFNKDWIKCLNAKPVKSRRPVKKHRMLFGNLFQYIPDLRPFLFHHLFCTLNRSSVTLLFN